MAQRNTNLQERNGMENLLADYDSQVRFDGKHMYSENQHNDDSGAPLCCRCFNSYCRCVTCGMDCFSNCM